MGNKDNAHVAALERQKWMVLGLMQGQAWAGRGLELQRRPCSSSLRGFDLTVKLLEMLGNLGTENMSVLPT